MKIHFEREIRLTHEMMADRRVMPRINAPRTKGVHVSAINQRLGIASKKLTDSDSDSFPFERMTETHYPLMMALGVGWEEFRASFYRDDELIWQPGELSRDQICGTPDGLIVDGPVMALAGTSITWECKRTTKKITTIADHWMYQKQGMSYAAMGAPRFVLYEILYVCGNYNRPYQPAAVSSLVEFNEAECEKWWSIVLREKDKVKPE